MDRILILNWRDPAHPDAGGAEVYCWEIATRLASMGHRVTMFTAQPPGLPSHSLIDGVEIVRRGGRYSVYARAAQYLAARRSTFDVVVDCQNGIPFFAPLFAPRTTAVIAVIHHVHLDQFGQHFSPPMRVLGQALEGPVSRWVYRATPTVVISPSTRKDVRRALRFRDAIHVVPCGAPPPVPRHARADRPTIAIVSRLVRQKRLELLFDAVAELAGSWPDLAVDVVGSGPDRGRLESRARGSVRFHGYRSEQEKAAIVGRAWLTVNPSQGEGWGLNVIEAAALGVPTVAFDVAGLRDSVVDGVTGWLVPPGGRLSDTIDAALQTLADPKEAERWADRCQQWCGRFSWDESAARLHRVITAERDRKAGGHARPGFDRRRRSTDLTSLAWLPEPDDDDRLRSLRRTDLVVTTGRGVQVLLHGADEGDALRALERVGFSSTAQVSVAQSADLLVGSAWPDVQEATA